MAGVAGKSGRKSKAQEMGLQALLDKCWKKKDREAVIETLAARAQRGDLEAIKLLMAYTYGKPTEKHEHSGPDGAPIETTFTIQRGTVLDAGDPSDS